MRPLVEDLEARLEALAAEGLGREMREPRGVDVCSNDYLGLAAHPALGAELARRLGAGTGTDTAIGAPSSRLLRGHTRRHRRLEERLAAWKGTERALLFPSGYQANLAVLTTLMGRQDRALSDALNHASLIDGLRLAGCRKVIFPHLELEAVERALAEPTSGGRTFLVTESLFSMDGDLAPLDRYARLAERHGASLIVDDAHATGLFGDARGSGWLEALGVERRAAAVVSTFGKALGLGAAFVAGPAAVVDTLVQRARPFVFTTAVPPLVVEAVDVALDLLEAEPWRRRRALELAERLRARLRRRGIDTAAGSGPIVPVLVGGNRRALAVAAALQERGFDARAVRPPTVPPGTARLRLSIHAEHDEALVDRLAESVARALAEAPHVPAGEVLVG